MILVRPSLTVLNRNIQNENFKLSYQFPAALIKSQREKQKEGKKERKKERNRKKYRKKEGQDRKKEGEK